MVHTISTPTNISWHSEGSNKIEEHTTITNKRIFNKNIPMTSFTKIGWGCILGSLGPAAFTALTLTNILAPVGSPLIVNLVLSVSSGFATIHSSAKRTNNNSNNAQTHTSNKYCNIWSLIMDLPPFIYYEKTKYDKGVPRFTNLGHSMRCFV